MEEVGNSREVVAIEVDGGWTERKLAVGQILFDQAADSSLLGSVAVPTDQARARGTKVLFGDLLERHGEPSF